MAVLAESPFLMICLCTETCTNHDFNKSSIRKAWHWMVSIRASEICFESWNFSQLEILDSCHFPGQFAKARRNWGFWSSITAAFPSLLFWWIRLFAFDVVHHVYVWLRNLAAFLWLERYERSAAYICCHKSWRYNACKSQDAELARKVTVTKIECV